MGPTSDQIHEWKSKYRIWKVVIGDQDYVYRQISAGEYISITNASRDDCEFEDSIIREALLYPTIDMDSSPTRLITDLAGCIVKSNMLDDTTRWQTYVDGVKDRIRPRSEGGRLVTSDPLIGIIVQIISAFPAYKPEELMELPIEKLLDRLAWSELALGNIPHPQRNSNIPMGLSPQDRQKYLEGQSAQASSAALQEEMRKRANAKSRS